MREAEKLFGVGAQLIGDEHAEVVVGTHSRGSSGQAGDRQTSYHGTCADK
jgi:hypothetical protein